MFHIVAIKNEAIDVDSLQPIAQTAMRMFWRFLDEFGEKYPKEAVLKDMEESDGGDALHSEVLEYIDNDYTVYIFDFEDDGGDVMDSVTALLQGMVNGTTIKMIEEFEVAHCDGCEDCDCCEE